MEQLSPMDKYKLIFPILEKEIPATVVSRNRDIPVRTLRHWIQQFSQKGLKGLERSKRRDCNTSKILSNEHLDLIKGFALQKPPLPISSIHRKMSVLCQRSDLRCPSYATVYSVVRKLSPALLALAHEGAKIYGEKYEMIYRRECKSPNEIWQVDHTQMDIYLIDNKGLERKPWLTTIIDDYSRAIAGIFISFEAPSALNTALALRQGIWKKENPDWQVCGIPQLLYTDHGADFMSAHIEQVCISLKIGMINSAVGRPQGRGKIERFFQTLNECVLIDLPGYSLKGKPVSKPSLDLKQLEAAVMDFILYKYHLEGHSTTGLPPLSMWSEGFMPQLPEQPEILDILLLSIHKPRKVQRDGIRFQGMRYIATTLAGFIGETVTIRYDPRDLAEIRVYYHDGFLCKAICQDIAEMVVSLKDIRTARSEVKKELYGQIKQSQLMFKKLSQKNEAVKSPNRKVKQTYIEQESPPLKLYDNE